MPILVGIDGTGSECAPGTERDARYDTAFANSFVRRICRGKANARYIRGPVMLGGGVVEGISEALSFIETKHRQMPNEPILLTGYSRGAAEMVAVAQRLHYLKIKVKALMLFDCVDRSLDMNASVVPNNVENVRHVIRNPATRSRATFGNAGMRYSAPTKYPPTTMFMCTHGGMGGTPWALPKDKKSNDFINEGAAEAWFSPVRNGPVWTYRTNVTYAQDAAVSATIWAQVQPFLAAHGF